jgi:hypothetical protein
MNANLLCKRIEMSKNEAKAAGKLNTPEANMLKEYRKEFPGFEIYIKPATRRKTDFKGLDYKYMRAYIQNCNRKDKDDIMEKFNILTAQDKKDGKENTEHLEAASYLDVKNWFLATFPEIENYRKEHKQKVQTILAVTTN